MLLLFAPHECSTVLWPTKSANVAYPCNTSESLQPPQLSGSGRVTRLALTIHRPLSDAGMLLEIR